MEGPDLQTKEVKCRGRKQGKGVASSSEQNMTWRPNSTQDLQRGFGLTRQAEMVELTSRNVGMGWVMAASKDGSCQVAANWRSLL